MDVKTVIEKRRLPRPAARRALRMTAGLRLQDIADACGVTLQTVWRWEQGLRQPRVGNLERYAEILHKCQEVISE
jgi:transcriptional regulator with XRE-family HTH domain